MFLQLLVAQMRYQDPMNPTDSSEFLAQSAQFTALEKMEAVADQTRQLLGAQMAFGASGLIGRHVSWADTDGTTKTGTVGGVTFTATGPLLDIDGTSVPLSSVQTVTSVADGTTPAA
jgi:flagellar basal-body rod modification protein FlgD